MVEILGSMRAEVLRPVAKQSMSCVYHVAIWTPKAEQ